MKFLFRVLILFIATTAQTAISQTYMEPMISLQSVDGGVGLGCYGFCGYFAADIKVKNFPYDKLVGGKTEDKPLGGMVYQFIDSEGKPLEPNLVNWSVAHGSYLEGSFNSLGEAIWRISFQLGALRNYKIEFALFFYSEGMTYWDNNDTKNYIWDNETNELLL